MGSTNSKAPPQNSIAPLEDLNKKKTCCQCQEQNQNLLKLECNHYYHIDCLIKKRMNSYQCICKQSIRQLNKFDESIHRLFLQQQVQMIFQKNQNKKNQQCQFVSCPIKQCTFYFIYVGKLNVNKRTHFFCDSCNSFRQYNEQIFYNCDNNDGQLQVLTYSDNQQKNNQLKSNDCKEQNISKEQLEQTYKIKLLRMIESSKLKIKYCKNNCGFIYVENNSYDISNNLCQNCNFCYKCNGVLFQDFIKIKICNHNFHYLCAFKLINPNNIQSLQCYCGQQIDDEETKIQLNIICMVCGKFDKNLKQLDCQHYIHLNCILDNSIKFSTFSCYICQIPILKFLSNPQHKQINDNLQKKNIERILEEIKKDCFICLNQSSENLINTQCNHKVHYSCLRRRQQELKNKRDQQLKCLCGQQIINQCQIIN